MTLYLVDASVVAEFLVGGTYTAHAQAFFKGAFTGDGFTIPELCLSECANVIWKAVQHRGMPAAQALQALRDLKALPLTLPSTIRCISRWRCAASRCLSPLMSNSGLPPPLRA